MKPIEKVTGYKTGDGTIFTEYSEAVTYQARLQLRYWLTETVPRGYYTPTDEILDWLIRSRGSLIPLLQGFDRGT